MDKKVETTKIGGGANYAKVSARLKRFWEENPNGKIDTEREDLPNGKIRFIARIWRDGGEVLKLAQAGTSADVIKMTANATASADATKKGDKENEKLETVAVGRALAMLGYLASGEVASREEMEEFEQYKLQQEAEELERCTEMMFGSKNAQELKEMFLSLSPKIRSNPEIIKAKDEMKAKLVKPVKEAK